MRVLPQKPSKAHRPRSGQPYSMPDQKIFGSARNSCSQLRVLLPVRGRTPIQNQHARTLRRGSDGGRRAQNFDTRALDQVCRKAQQVFCEERMIAPEELAAAGLWSLAVPG